MLRLCYSLEGFSGVSHRRLELSDRTAVGFRPLLQKPDDRKDYGEPRIRAAGLIEGVPFMVVCTVRGDCFRIISARKMHRKEWIQWQE
ncbi:BrnT family toxin [Gluconobacter oxydans]|uniref:BrnT family toxin n=1 Tax=Gluconobacter oxydans TaxID=442 RepID=UPI0007863BCE|nr:BrnT family toxin [Gluconobacter oxydans]KXV17466.1 hypothetical protein AD932_00595 [Gluconobacter oxydans]WKE49688.1 BrnT family toxin [Gluconobacter oxydans]WKE49715.1 BrnT family toxin [Gluconobacter oxydans]